MIKFPFELKLLAYFLNVLLSNRGVWLAIGIATLAASCGSGSAAEITMELRSADAVSAAAFLDSFGVNTHFTFTDSPYATRYAEVRAALVELGVHHVRDVPNDHMTDLAAAGITTTLLAEPNFGTPEAFRDRVKALNAGRRVVDAVEGANEPDMFWQRLHISWRGHGYPEGPVLWQHDLYRVFKADAATAGLTIIGPSLGLAGMPNATPPASWAGLRAYADWGDFHPYPYNGNPFGPSIPYGGLKSFYADGTFPSVSIDRAPDAYRAYAAIYGTGPMAATETGYPTGPHFTAEALQAKYLPRLYAEYFRLGIKRAFVYQLLDNVQDPQGKDPDASFGLLRHDLTQRPAFRAVAALTHLLARPHGPGPAPPAGLVLTLTVNGAGAFADPSQVHHLLLRRPDATLLLLLWNEVSGEDASTMPRRSIEVPGLQGQISASRAVRFAIVGQRSDKTEQLNVSVADDVVAVEISR